ncbi:hypothetical protein PVK06_030264 [Gossypium arboreum]|uniref:Retrotransposon gag domain-containing protein n=1 Tax=Gossypium arboreum TaxID=29729 RepID=A0ABR0NMU0_GOSAR|nr:hypothetical protein PVK06_030264 [Gossypium arboreum]
MQGEISQMDGKIYARLETRLQGFKDDFKGEIRSKLQTLRSELHGLLEQYFDSFIVPSNVATQDRGKGVMGSRPPPPEFPQKCPTNTFQASVMMTLPNSSIQEKVVRWGCPHFDGTRFRDWWSKLEQYFKVEGIPVGDNVRIVMLNLDGKVLEWHYFYAQKHRGLQALDWTTYAISLKERFSSSLFPKPMSELVNLKQHGSIEQYHEEFREEKRKQGIRPLNNYRLRKGRKVFSQGTKSSEREKKRQGETTKELIDSKELRKREGEQE